MQVVGILQRARKYEILHFEGETLFQGQNDLTPIYLLKYIYLLFFVYLLCCFFRSLSDVQDMFKPNSTVEDKDFQWGVIGKKSVSS